jgi:hydroxymethylbilane synthase
VAPRPIIIGTRGSKLALRQAQMALDALQAAHPEAAFETKIIRTSGDSTEAPLSEVGGRGIFVIEIERSLLKNEIDIAVHSLKDLPGEETPNLSVVAVLPREDPRDVLITRTGGDLGSLAAGATVGTGSPRRASAIRALRSDLQIADIRGNVDTRLRKVEEGQYDATVLAAAGLSRLGWLDRAAQTFDIEQMVPAVGQGALAIQTRTDDTQTSSLVATLDDADTRAAVTAERAFERRLGGGCHAAIAAHGTVDGAALLLRAFVGSEEGTILRGEIDAAAAEAETLGTQLAEQLLAEGAAEMLEAAQ